MLEGGVDPSDSPNGVIPLFEAMGTHQDKLIELFIDNTKPEVSMHSKKDKSCP